MNNVIRLFQQQVPLDSKVKVFLTNGQETAGVLDEISRAHITLRKNGKPLTLLLNMIGGWEVIEDTVSEKPDLHSKENSDEEVATLDLSRNIKETIKDSDTHQPTNGSASNTLKNDKTSLPSNSDLEIYTELIEINAHFQAHLQTATGRDVYKEC